MSNHAVLTVTQVNTYIKSIIDGDFRLSKLMIRGEISNFTNHYRTGHYYLTIKDANSSLRAVMFKSSVMKLKFVPENGMAVIVSGRISVFERDGQYQLYIDDIQPDGIGALTVAFEQMKERLAKEGLFDSQLKKPIPEYPARVGVITSPTGAAVRDIFNVLERRYPLADIVFAPVLVQGSEAPLQLVLALEEMNRKKCCDVIIIGRGGGSMEELWAFNDEKLARTVAASKIPVISAVGHETDFTICDFAADLRAPTPSAAAELAVPDIMDLKIRLGHYAQSLLRIMNTNIREERGRLRHILDNAFLKDPLFYVNNQKQVLDHLSAALIKNFSDLTAQKTAHTKLAVSRLDSLSPLKVLSRGYSIVTKGGKPLKRINDVSSGDIIDIKMDGGSLTARVESVLENKEV